MSIRNRLLLLLLAIALTPLVFTSLFQQVSIWIMRDRLGDRTRAALEANARQGLQEQLQSDAEILELDRQLADVQLRRQVREVEQRLAGLTPPPRRGPGGRGPDPDFARASFGASPRPVEGRFDPNAREAGVRGRSGFRGNLPGEMGRGPRPMEYAVANAEFGLDPNLSVSADMPRSYPQAQSAVSSGARGGASDANIVALKVNYQAQSCLVARGEDEALAQQAMEKLAGMTSAYRDFWMRGPAGILWLHTSLDIGLHLTYPGGAMPRDLSRYNPLVTSWYLQARAAYDAQQRLKAGGDTRPQPPGGDPSQRRGRPGMGRGDFRWERMLRQSQAGTEARQGLLTWDRFTGQAVVIRSMPITYANGDFAGAAAMVRTVPEIFSSLQLPERWGTDVERMLILSDPNASAVQQKVLVVLEDRREREGQPAPGRAPAPMGRGGPLFGRLPGLDEIPSRPLSLDPNDLPVLNAMTDDIAKDQAGVRQIRYGGRPCLLAYQPLDIPQTAAVLVVPYDTVVAMAKDVEQPLVQESVRWLQIMTLVLLVVGVAAVSLAAVRARNLTQPINALIQAGKQLGSGDYNARVDIHTNDELENLGRVFNEAGPKLRDHARMKQSLELASAVQQSLLPGAIPELEHFELAGRCVYCDETGGDYYDFIRLADHESSAAAPVAHSPVRPFPHSDSRVGLALGDVSGHGIGAALLMAGTRGLLHAEAPHMGEDLAALMTRLNRELVRDTAEETFVTLFYGILDDVRRSLVWTSAGHEPATWYHASNRQIEELPNTGMLLGVLPDAVYRQAGPVTFAPGDILVVGTDGIWEAHDDSGHYFGKERFHRIIQDAAALSATEICDRIIDSVTMFSHPAPRSDDITLIVVKAR